MARTREALAKGREKDASSGNTNHRFGRPAATQVQDSDYGRIEIHGGVPIIDESNPADPDGVWTLYEGPSLCKCHTNWVDEIPIDVKYYQDNEEFNKSQPEAESYALVVRMKRIHGSDIIPRVYLDNITVQSKLLNIVLHNLLSKYTGITLDLKAPVLTAPFMPMFHHWDQWETALVSQTDERTLCHMKLLDRILRDELAPAFEARAAALKENVISWEYLWTLYTPGDLAYSHKGQPRVYEVKSVTEQGADHNRRLDVVCEYTDYNGTFFGRATHRFYISFFSGNKAINKLPVYPVKCVENQNELLAQLQERAQRVLSLAGVHCMEYAGRAETKHEDSFDDDRCIDISGRIVIDAKAYCDNLNPSHLRQLKEYSKKQDQTKEVEMDVAGDSLTTTQLCTMTPLLRGWSLVLNRWLTFDVDFVKPPSWNTHAFGRLSLPDDFRQLIQATVEMQLKRVSHFDDFITGKGKGFVLLFSGSPGVGKTTTVEAIAEVLQVPLYVLPANIFTSEPEEFEDTLQAELARAARWKAVCLLDEADIFLESRDNGNAARTATVTMFLRTLEYHQGVLCLTTNHANKIDSAIRSRVQLSLKFPDLTSGARENVWRQFANHMAKGTQTDLSVDGGHTAVHTTLNITDEEFEELAKVDVDGRQIKNAFKTAVLMAQWKNIPLDFACLTQSLRIVKEHTYKFVE